MKEGKKKERRKENLDKGKQTKQVNKKIFKSGKCCRKKLNTVMGTGWGESGTWIMLYASHRALESNVSSIGYVWEEESGEWPNLGPAL